MNKAVEATKQTAADMTDAAQEAGNHAVETTKKWNMTLPRQQKMLPMMSKRK